MGSSTASTCPAMDHYVAADLCQENFAGIAGKVYIGFKEDLSAPMALTDTTYSAPSFKSGTGLYEIDCKEKSNNIGGKSLKKRKGFKLTYNIVVDAVNKKLAKISRALNNRDFFVIVQDGDEWQIMYDPVHNIEMESGSIKSETGSAPEDDRQTTFGFVLQPVKYQNLYVTITNIATLVEGYSAG